MRDRTNVLLLGNDATRIAPLLETLGRAARVCWVEDLPEALQKLAQQDFQAVFVDWDFYCGSWREALQRIQELYPALPVIVLGTPQEDRLWEQQWKEAVEAGAFDLLPSIENRMAVLLVLEQAVASSEARARGAVA
ncbi:MAG TPA: hypothetical protein VNN17_10460 [Terriglobia bacterium]|nr:hypothetical protein [Terriglobia bacterium]